MDSHRATLQIITADSNPHYLHDSSALHSAGSGSFSSSSHYSVPHTPSSASFYTLDDQDDEIVLTYPTKPTLFTNQRSQVLKINALAVPEPRAFAAFLDPLNLPRSLWTLASLQQGHESFVWAIFDSHEHALSALQALRIPLAEPALESDLLPFDKLRKVEMNSWCARWIPARREHEQRELQSYSPESSPSSATSPVSTKASEQEQDTITPIPSYVLPVQEDHSTPIPAFCAPAPVPMASTTTTTTANADTFASANTSANGIGREMNLHLANAVAPLPTCRKHHIDADGGVVFGGGAPLPPPPEGSTSVSMSISDEDASAAGVNQVAQGQGGKNAASPASSESHERFTNSGIEQVYIGTRLHTPTLDDASAGASASLGVGARCLSIRDRDRDRDLARDSDLTQVICTLDPSMACPPSSTSDDHHHRAQVDSHSPLLTSLPTSHEPIPTAHASSSAHTFPDESIPKQEDTATKGDQPLHPSAFSFASDLPLEFVPYDIDSRDREVLAQPAQPAQVQGQGLPAEGLFYPASRTDHDRDREGYDHFTPSSHTSRAMIASMRTDKRLGFSPGPTPFDSHARVGVIQGVLGEKEKAAITSGSGRELVHPPTSNNVIGERSLYPSHQPYDLNQHVQKSGVARREESSSLQNMSFFQPERLHHHQQQQQHHFLSNHNANQSQPLMHSLGNGDTSPTPFIAPPNSFRSGDWLCSVPACSAHNFGRNVVCIMCGSARPNGLSAGSGAAGAGARQSGISSMSMGMGMGSDQNEYLHGGNSNGNGRLSQSTYIPVIPRPGQNYNAPLLPRDIAANNVLVQALGGIGEVAAIQEAIKAHQSQMLSQDGKSSARLDRPRGGGGEAPFMIPNQPGQLLIPTTLGNSPGLASQAPVVLQQNRGDVRRVQTPHGGHHHQPSPLSPLSPSYGMQQQQQMSPFPLNAFSPPPVPMVPVIPASKIPALLTPSGRKFAAGGRVQNISRDELNPILMFWPDNEPLPLASQIRPPTAILMALGGVQGPPPPILNTGNKGPIDAQPGDWTCGKCDYLNWRRRRVCANCFPHAEGNTEGTKHSTNDVQERVALLASVIVQQQQQVQAQQQQIQSQQRTSSAFMQNGFAAAPQSMRLPAMTPQPQPFMEPRRHDSLPSSNTEPLPLHVLARRYGYAVPPPSSLRQPNSNFVEQLPPPFNLPPRMIHPSASDGMLSRNFMDPLEKHAPNAFQPFRGGAMAFDGFPPRRRHSPPSSRSSFSVGSNGSFYHSANEPTPSPLPLLPAFLQEVVGETSESSASSVHESPSPPSPASQSSAFGNMYAPDPRVNDLIVSAGMRRTERRSSPNGPPSISTNIHRTTSHSSIWSLGYPGDRKEDGIRHV